MSLMMCILGQCFVSPVILIIFVTGVSGNLVRHLDTTSGGVFLSQNVRLVSLVHLLQENESKDSVGPKPEVIGRESFPEGEKSLVLNLEVAETLFKGANNQVESSNAYLTTFIITSAAPLYSGLPSIIFMFWILKLKGKLFVINLPQSCSTRIAAQS